MADFDSPWKEALDRFFRAFLLLLFPDIHDDIDWSRPIEMLDKEFQQLAPRAAQGRRTVDKLVKVWRRNGRPVWVLIHVEVQAQRDRHFSRRMAVYNNRIYDHYQRDVVSLAVLADDDPTWQPGAHRRSLWDCTSTLKFRPAKLLNFAGREAELEASDNPFAKIVLAHLKTIQTRETPGERRDWKLRIAQGLHECGFADEEVQELLRLVEWLMELPPTLERDFKRRLTKYQEGRRMPFVTIWGRDAMLELIADSLRAKFGDGGVKLLPAIEEMDDAEKYKMVNRAILTATSLDEVRRACAEIAAPAPQRKKNGKSKRGRSKT